ncbi:MAG: BadF/BadG/BcrA/BcrD ATPase family protein [Acutalibacteraceae bacterium]
MQNNGIFIGIDGGGTNTRLAAVKGGTVLFENKGGSSNLCSNDIAVVENNLRELFVEAPENVSAICIGSAGIITDEHKKQLRNIIERITGCKNIIVTNDSVIALEAELYDKPGISVTAGTGSICCGKNNNGDYVKAGGWGHIFSDEGSAYFIAAQGLKKAFSEYDNGKISLLMKVFLDKSDCGSPEALIEKMYSHTFYKAFVAELAVGVNQAAVMGDCSAGEILSNSGKLLADLCKTVHQRLRLNNSKFTIVCNGSVLTKDRFVREAFEESFDEYNCEIINGKSTPVIGAVKMAQNFE